MSGAPRIESAAAAGVEAGAGAEAAEGGVGGEAEEECGPAAVGEALRDLATQARHS